MGYSIDHMNPWEKMDKRRFLGYLDYIDKTVTEYERNSVFAQHLIPERIHSKIMALSSAISSAKDFYAYYQDAKELYDIIDILNNQDVFTDSAKAAKVYGRLFMCLGSIAMKNSNPLVKSYGQVINMLGQKLERWNSLTNGTHGNSQYNGFDPHLTTGDGIRR